MNKGIKQIQQNMKNIDCIVEVHDARIPLSGRNRHFKKIFGEVKPHILVLNKKDLSDLSYSQQIITSLNNEGISSVLFTNCKEPHHCSGLRELVPMVRDLISNSERFNRSENRDYAMMITGVPNVGKSSLINALRCKYLKAPKAAPVGGLAGVTRSVTSRIKVSDTPLIYVMDTPGILEPSVSNIEAGFKLALCSSMQDHLVGPTNIADFLLFWLNKSKNFSYVDYLKIKEPSDDITEVLVLAAVSLNKIIKRRNAEGGYTILPDTEFAANHFLRAFREGEFGKVMLDID